MNTEKSDPVKDEQSDYDKAMAKIEKHTGTITPMCTTDYHEGLGPTRVFGFGCILRGFNGGLDSKAAELQPVIDGLREEAAYYNTALDCIRGIARDNDYARGTTFEAIADVAFAACKENMEPEPEPPENLKALREAKNLSVEYVNHHLHRTGLVADIEDYEDGDGRFCNDSPISFVLAHIFGIAEPRVFAAHQQSVGEREVLGEL